MNIILAYKRNSENKIKIEVIQLISPSENTPAKQENIKSESENLGENKDDNQISNNTSIKKDDNKDSSVKVPKKIKKAAIESWVDPNYKKFRAWLDYLQ